MHDNIVVKLCILSLLLFPLAAPASNLKIDAQFPGGNINLVGVDGNTVLLRPDLRDTEGNWFYWAFRVRGAAGQTVNFVFTEQKPIGVRGPAVSGDEGKTWRWLGRDNATDSQFSYTFGASENSVTFATGMIYTQATLDAFLQRLGAPSALHVDSLTTSRKGRSVDRLLIGGAMPKHRILITARHHACEMMASYVLEGVIEAALADDEVGRWFQHNIELAAIPFVDTDGVEDGDQGKNRRPRDHNRDYVGDSIHPETAAIRRWVPQWADGKLIVTVDLHCPTLRGAHNEVIYQVGQRDPRICAEQQRLAPILHNAIAGPLPYDPRDDVPFGTAWNIEKNFAKGQSCSGWAATIPGVKLATTIEFPYANASGKEVNRESARAFGHDLAKALRVYVAD